MRLSAVSHYIPKMFYKQRAIRCSHTRSYRITLYQEYSTGDVLMDHLLILLLVMVVFGLLGGVVNFIYSYPNGRKKALMFVDLLKSLITGVAASFLVPVFLNMISSNIIRESETDPIMLLVFAGFCVIASVSSKAFIRAISNRVLERVNKVEEEVQTVKAKIRPVVLKHTELDDTGRANEDIPDTSGQAIRNGATPDARIKVLEKLSESDYAFRTINGLARDMNMEPETVRECLEDCISYGLAGQIENSMGTRFYITEDGQSHLLNHGGSAEDQQEDGSPAVQAADRE